MRKNLKTESELKNLIGKFDHENKQLNGRTCFRKKIFNGFK